MDTFRALNELATIDAAAKRVLTHLGAPPAEPREGNRVENLHYRAYKAAEKAQDYADVARKAVEKLDPRSQEELAVESGPPSHCGHGVAWGDRCDRCERGVE